MPSLMNGCVSACVTVIRFSGSKVNILSSRSASWDTLRRSASPRFLSCAASTALSSLTGLASRMSRRIAWRVTGSSSTTLKTPSWL